MTDQSSEWQAHHEERLAAALRVLREGNGISQEAMAERLSVSRLTFRSYEAQPSTARMATLLRWCAELGQPLPKVLRFAMRGGRVSTLARARNAEGQDGEQGSSDCRGNPPERLPLSADAGGRGQEECSDSGSCA